MNTSSKSVKVVIISSYKYDKSYIDDNRAWNTVYTIFFPETRNIVTFDEATGFGEDIFEGHPEYEFISMNDDIKIIYNEVLEENRKHQAEYNLNKFTKEINAYNESMRPQEKGQIVEIMGGRRKGKLCKISWIGKGRKFGFDVDRWYRKAYPQAAALIDCINYRPYSIPAKNFDTIRVWPLDGTDPFYISIDKAKVVEGFKPISITFEEVYNYNRDFSDSFSRKWNNGYDYNNNI